MYESLKIAKNRFKKEKKDRDYKISIVQRILHF